MFNSAPLILFDILPGYIITGIKSRKYWSDVVVIKYCFYWLLQDGDGKLCFRNYLNFIVGKARPLLKDASFMQAMFNVRQLFPNMYAIL